MKAIIDAAVVPVVGTIQDDDVPSDATGIGWLVAERLREIFETVGVKAANGLYRCTIAANGKRFEVSVTEIA